ncbi:ring-type E3 ubiquitin transferase [Vairimorpha necatrix]|uniref:Ring-type E3 ubiquitin transferase n=1 Tax=Vairimorpha necatrix TaxID=6039 RepID=A0AAX4JCY6_9MICR
MDSDCAICMSKSHFIVEYECKHTLCITCGIRLVKLYKKKECTLCKQISKKIIVKNKKSKLKEEINSDDVIYQNKECKDKVLNLLIHKCKKCQVILKDIYELRAHYREVHASLLCYECIDNKKQFWFEHNLYSVSTLRCHKNGKLNEDGFRGHVYCSFCNIFLYDESCAKQHCIQSHVSCTVCDLLGIKNRFYNNFVDLEAHFKNAHYCCTFKYCQNIKAYVFPYKTELLEHLLKFHKQISKFNDISSTISCNIPYFDPFYLSTQNNIKINILNNSVINLKMNDFKHNTQAKEIPTYLDRTKITENKRNQSLRKSLIKRNITKNQEEVIEIAEKIVNKRLSIIDGCADLKLLMDENVLLKLLKELNFEEAQNEMKDYYKILEKQILFPKFEKKISENTTNTRKETKPVGFKILNLKNYKK